MKILQAIKKAAALVLAIFLLITSTGVELNAHYCETTLVSINVWAEAQSCSQVPGEEKSELPNEETNISEQNCCNSKTVFSKTDIESDVSFSLNLDIVAEKAFVLQGFIPQTKAKAATLAIINTHSPPLKNSRFVLFQNFRI